MAAEIGADRSMIIRLMVEHVLGHGSPEVEVCRSLLITGLLGRKGRPGRVADRIASAVVENLKDLVKAYLAARGGAKTKARSIEDFNRCARSPRGVTASTGLALSSVCAHARVTSIMGKLSSLSHPVISA